MPRAKPKKTHEQLAAKLSRRLLPDVQARRGGFAVVDIANRTEGDQRHMVRSQERQTLRRKSKLEILFDARVISKEDQLACEWYAKTYAQGYDTIGVTAQYGEASRGGGDGAIGLMARYRDQARAREDYAWARQAICPILLPLFEKVVLHGRPMGRLSLSFKRAVAQLRERVDRVVPLA